MVGERTFSLSSDRRIDIVAQLRAALSALPEIAFAYLYGSALDSDRIHDVDVGLYLCSAEVFGAVDRVADLSNRLSAMIEIPVNRPRESDPHNTD